jgi:hypothetical protein
LSPRRKPLVIDKADVSEDSYYQDFQSMEYLAAALRKRHDTSEISDSKRSKA